MSMADRAPENKKKKFLYFEVPRLPCRPSNPILPLDAVIRTLTEDV
jgi:hypothetical protein